MAIREHAQGDDLASVADEDGFREVVLGRRDEPVEGVLLAVVPQQRLRVLVSARPPDDLITGVGL